MSTAVQIGSPQGTLRRRAIGIYSVLAVFNIGAVIWAFITYGMKRYDELEAYPVKR